MAQVSDTSAIQRLIGQGRLRIRGQWALQGATTATMVAALVAFAAIVALRLQLVTLEAGIALLVGAGAIIVIGAVVAASRRLDDETVARRIDRASNLADRLSTAIAFDRTIRAGRAGTADPDLTFDLMHAAIRDGIRAAPRANVRSATPFAIPKHLRAAAGLIVIAALGMVVPTPDHPGARVVRAAPDHAPPGAEVVIQGDHLLPEPSSASRGVPSDAAVYLGTLDKSRPVTIVDWNIAEIHLRLPGDAPIGDTKLLVFRAGGSIGAVDFTVVDKKDSRYHKDNSVALEPDEKAYVQAILAELKNVAQRDKVPELDDFAKQIEQLLDKAETGEITKEQLLDALAKAEDALNKDAEPHQAAIQKQLGDMGKELAKDQLTKELGEALQKNELDKAKQELEKLADKIANKELTEQQKDQLGKKLDQVAKELEKQDDKTDKQQDQQQKKLEDEIRRLEQKKDQAKNDQQRQDLERRLEDKKRELQKLKKDEDEQKQSDQRRAVKRLEKDMEKAAENLQKPKDPKDQQQQDQKDQQASQKLKDAARETGRVDQDQRKQATQKKMSSQMDDLREAMRRAKQKRNKGPEDPFHKQGKNQDFISRARGEKGQGQAWKPGQGQGGQGQGGKGGQGQGSGGQGQQPGGSEWGVGHDDNLTGDPTQKSGNVKDQELQGQSGSQGSSTRDTILAAAQKGFASVGYKKVYADYQRIVEEVMRTEKLPSSYKYYVKRYFAKIHPSMEPQQ